MSFDPLAQLQSMPAEPKLGEKQDKERDNEAYKAETMPNLEQARANLARELYGQKNIVENSKWENNIETEKTIELAELENSPYFPILKGLLYSWNIDYETYQKSVEHLQNIKKDEAQEVITWLVNNLWNEEIRESILKQLNSNEKVNEKNFEQTQFYTDAKSRLGIDKWIWWLELMLAENYIQIPQNSWETNTEQDLATTIETVLNKILEKNSPDFTKQNAINIWLARNSSSLSERYSALKQVYKEDLKTDAIAWGKKWKEEITRKKDSLKAKAEEITKQITDAKNITDTQEKEQHLAQLQIEKSKIIEEANKVDMLEWELFAWNQKIEDAEKNNPEITKQAA